MRQIITLGDDTHDIFTYPAGEIQVRLNNKGKDLIRKNLDAVLARIHSSDDILKTLLLLSAIKGLQGYIPKLILPYLPYSRADRRFINGDCEGLRTFLSLLAPSVNELLTIDAHSLVAKQLFNNLVDIPPNNFISKILRTYMYPFNEVTLILPDEGAYNRYGSMFNGLLPVVHCTKHRDPETGKLSGFEAPEVGTKSALVIDDICDGGGTFIGIANELKGKNPYLNTLNLYVTHGIFSKGVDDLYKSGYSSIFTTNSFKTVMPFGVGVINIEPELEKYL